MQLVRSVTKAGRETIEDAHLAGVRAIAKMLTGIEEVIRLPLTSSPPPRPVRAGRKTAGARRLMQDLMIMTNSFSFVVADTDPAEVDVERHRDDIADIIQALGNITHFLDRVLEQGA